MPKRTDIESILIVGARRIFFSSPLAGEDGRDSGQEGGAPKAPTRAKLSVWPPKTHARCAKLRPRQRSGFGRYSDDARSTAAVFADRFRSIPTSRTLSASRTASSSRWTAVSTRANQNAIGDVQDGSRDRASACCDSGTMRYLRTPKVSARRSKAFCRNSIPPSLTLPRKGGGNEAAQNDANSEITSRQLLVTFRVATAK